MSLTSYQAAPPRDFEMATLAEPQSDARRSSSFSQKFAEEVGAEGGFGGGGVEMAVGMVDSEAVSVSAAVDDAGVGRAGGDLAGAARDGLVPGAVELVFPADEARGGEPGAQLRE